jgi:hypothetical protein
MSNEITDDYGVSVAGNNGGATNAFDFSRLGREVKFLKAKEAGAMVFDIIQRKDGTVAQLYRVHRKMGPNHMHDIVCPRQFGGQCPVCDMQKDMATKLEAAGVVKPWSTKEVKALFPQERVVYNVKLPNDPDGPMMLLEGSEFKMLKRLSAAAATHKQVRTLQRFPYASPTEGSSVVATITNGEITTSNGKLVKYFDWDGFTFMERKHQYHESILDDVIEVEKYFNVLDYATIEKILYGIVDENTETFEDDMPDEASTPAVVAGTKAPVEEVLKPVIGAKTATSVPIGTVPDVTTSELKCPADGRFGKDFNSLEDCENCDFYLECRRAKRAGTAI